MRPLLFSIRTAAFAVIARGSSVSSFGVEAVREERPVAFTTEIWVMLRDKRRRKSVKRFKLFTLSQLLEDYAICELFT